MAKYCRKCGKLNENPLLKFCMEHQEYNTKLVCRKLAKKTPIKPKSYKIKQKSTKNKNSVAKFSIKTKKQIVERDKTCILCGKPGTDCHHIYFSQQAEYGENRNNLNKGVLLCRLCHGKAHGCKSGEGVRQEVINYINNQIKWKK